LVGALAGCVGYSSVPLRDGSLPEGAIEIGDDIRVRDLGGATAEFEVTAVEADALIGATERAELANLSYVGVAHRRRAVWITLGVLGAIVIYERNSCDTGGFVEPCQ